MKYTIHFIISFIIRLLQILIGGILLPGGLAAGYSAGSYLYSLFKQNLSPTLSGVLAVWIGVIIGLVIMNIGMTLIGVKSDKHSNGGDPKDWNNGE